MREIHRILSVIIFVLALPLISVAQTFITPVQQVDLLFAGDIMQHQAQLDMARQEDGKYSFT